MDELEIEKKVTEILVTKLGISKTEFNPEFTLKDLGADSLDEVEIILDLE
jgi:acyl carrier protein